MTVRTFDGKKVASLCDTRCVACGQKKYTWPTGLCDGCSYHSNPEMRAWVDAQLAKVAAHGKA